MSKICGEKQTTDKIILYFCIEQTLKTGSSAVLLDEKRIIKSYKINHAFNVFWIPRRSAE